MQIDAQLIDRLLYEEEGSEIDFKREQYRFTGASDDDKSELLKDVLAFANAWRRSDAFIMIGVEEVKGGKSSVVGIAEDLDDAKLQQFVNSKVQRPILFSYRAILVGQLRVGVIHIPIQERPLYLKKDFGKLKKGTVYIRRGSSTDQADPDEIARMGSEAILVAGLEPRLSVLMGDARKRELIGAEIAFDIVNLRTPSEHEIPDYREERDAYGLSSLSHVNSDYYRRLVDYITITERVRGFSVAVQNSGDVIAHDVRVVFEIGYDERTITLRRSIPEEPRSRRELWNYTIPMNLRHESDVQIEKLEGAWRVEVSMGKIQAKDTAWSNDKIYIGAFRSGTFLFAAKIFADNLSRPTLAEVLVNISVTSADADLRKILEIYDERFMQSDEFKRVFGASEEDEEV